MIHEFVEWRKFWSMPRTEAPGNICVPDAAEQYGLQINRNGMCSCPFHEGRHLSMKLNERYFYCFGCEAAGDVILRLSASSGRLEMQ